MENKTIMDEKNRICMKTLGCFELTYGEKSLLQGKTKESQISLVLQCLLHERNQGVSREKLEEILFEKRDIEDKHHALQSVLYNTKNKLRRIGLPEVQYIQMKEGIFYWNPEIVVWEDAFEFEKMYQKAVQEESEEQKIEYYLAACHLYEGEFLLDYNMIPWVAAETRRYRKLFDTCVQESVKLLRGREDYERMAKLGEYASQRMKYENYEKIAMESFSETGNYQEAMRYYERVQKEYMETQNMVPAMVHNDYMEKLAASVSNPLESMDVIYKKLSEINESGAYYCPYPIFKGIYQILKLSQTRDHLGGCLMLCTLSDKMGKALPQEKVGRELAAALQESISINIRRGDVLTRYSYGQYLILLRETRMDRCANVQKRITQHFRGKIKKYKIVYCVEKI